MKNKKNKAKSYFVSCMAHLPDGEEFRMSTIIKMTEPNFSIPSVYVHKAIAEETGFCIPIDEIIFVSFNKI